MSERRKPSLILPVAVAVLLAGYFGAYYGLVSPSQASARVGSVYWVGRNGPYGSVKEYKKAQWLDAFFAPVNWVDRRIRPDVWKPKHPLPGNVL